jgi:hydroxymethylbilane synthase
MALAQAARAESRLAARLSSLTVEEVLIETPVSPERQIVRIAERVRDGQADAGVCSAAHLGFPLPAGVVVAALFRDRDACYRLVSPERPSLSSLPGHATIVTCDPVARGQIRRRLPRLQVELSAPSWEIFAGLRHRAWDAACLPPEIFDVGSLAGLDSALVAAEEVLPAVGQGVAALLARADDARVRERLAEINDPELEATLGAERAFLAALSGGPLDAAATARAVPAGGWMELTGILVHLDGRWIVSRSARSPLESASDEARRLAEACREQAAKRESAEAAPREVLVH